MRMRAAFPALLCLLAACGGSEGPPLEVSGVNVFAPVPGSRMGVAYLTVSNRSRDAVVVNGARSPEFEQAEIHETVLEGGVSSMRRMETLTIGGGESVVFEAGGRHLMLIGPRDGTVAGSSVTLEIEHDRGLLIVSAILKDRLTESR